MKVKNLLLILLLLSGVATATAQKTKYIHVTFKYNFAHDPDGKEINTRLKVYVDGAVKGVSLAKMETEANAVTVEVPSGTHKIKAVIESQYEGGWEEHTKVNEYTIDCIYEKELNITKTTRIDLVFDLESGTIVIDHQTTNGNFSSPF